VPERHLRAKTTACTTTHCCVRGQVVGAGEVAEAEVRDLEVLVLVQQQVLRLQVTMHHALLVTVRDGADELAEVLAGRLLVEAAGAHNLVEKLASLDKLEDKEDVALRCQHLLELHHVLVRHLLHDGDLLLDLRAHVLLLDLRLAEDLDGHLLARLTVDGVLHFAERALAKRLADLILADALRHGGWWWDGPLARWG
jgi:hypothetical protein